MSMKRLLVIPLLLLSGCSAMQIHPGAANQFDSSTYDTLLITDSVIQSTKADLAANKFPASIAPKVKTSLNVLIQAYDVADTSYLTYHASAASGTVTAAQQTTVQSDLATVQTATANLTSAKAGQ